MQIEDHVFVVTGASSGIGLATAKALAERGGKAALLARSRDVLEELADRLPGSLPIVADMTDFASVRATIARAHGHYGSTTPAGATPQRSPTSSPSCSRRFFISMSWGRSSLCRPSSLACEREARAAS